MMKWLVISTLFVLANVAFSCINPPPVWRDRGQKLTITCPKDMYISVVFSASYASIPANICSDPNALTTVRDECLNKHSCTINVQSQSPFPCPGLGDRNARLWVDYACCRGTPTDQEECEPTPVEVRPQVGDCISEKPITVFRCMGGCESGAEYQFGTGKLEKECDCCVPTKTKSRTEPLKCRNGKTYRYTFVDVVGCDCKPCDEDPPSHDCHVDTEEIYPRINGCVGISKITIGKCHGGCPSSSRFPGQSTLADNDCTCCVPIRVKQLTTTVRCRSIAAADSFISISDTVLPPNLKRVKYHLIQQCDCRPCKRNPFFPGAVTDAVARAVEGETGEAESPDASAVP